MTYTAAQAAKALGISRNSVYELLRRGELRSVRIGHRLIIPKAAIAELVGDGEPASALATPRDRVGKALTFDALTPHLLRLLRRLQRALPLGRHLSLPLGA
jgi:excisionase family DNA binding protein